VELDFARKRVCEFLGGGRARRSTRAAAAVRNSDGVVIEFPRRSPRTQISDGELLVLIRKVNNDSPFAGKGHRKVTARLRREHGVHVGRKRILRLMRAAGLLAPQPAKRRRRARPHDGTIIPRIPMFCGARTPPRPLQSATAGCGAFCCVDHFTAEAWTTVAKRGDRFACLEPIYDAVTDRFGKVDKDVARGIALRHDWDPNTSRATSRAPSHG
jgi:putative transposase